MKDVGDVSVLCVGFWCRPCLSSSGNSWFCGISQHLHGTISTPLLVSGANKSLAGERTFVTARIETVIQTTAMEVDNVQVQALENEHLSMEDTKDFKKTDMMNILKV